MKNKSQKILLAGSLFLLVVTGCNPRPTSAAGLSTSSSEPVVIVSDTPGPTLTSTPTETSTLTPTDTPTATPTETFTPAATATFVVLRGEVLILSNCRYGPGAPYLYFTGLLPGSNLEVIGRREDSQWVYVQAIGGHSPCWVKASQMDIKGDVNSLEIYYPDKAILPVSPYYSALTGVKAKREGDQVTITWTGVTLRAGDEESPTSPLYVLEAWTCQSGQIVFSPIGLMDNKAIVTDQQGCPQPSHARVFLSEKHGYAGPSDVPWPPFPTPTP